MASLVLYGSSVLDTGGLGTASKMSNTTGGTETSKKTTITGVGPTYAEITSQGLTVADVTSIPATPTGRGWIYYPGAGSFALGNWSAAITLAFVLHGAPNTTMLRAFRYSSGAYTLIGSISATTATLAKTTYTFAPTSFGTITFGTSDGVYFDLWWNDASGDPSGDNPTVYVSNSAVAGVANDFVITTSNFTSSGGSVSLSCTLTGVGVLSASLTLGSSWAYLGQYTVFIGGQLV